MMKRTALSLALICTLPSAHADFRFVFNGHTYDVIETASTWSTAASEASKRSFLGQQGYLARIDNEYENARIYVQLANNISTSQYANTAASDGGGASYVWIGANDISSEGKWVWKDNNQQFWQGTANGSAVDNLYNKWGNEPDNYQNNQDAAAIALTEWPVGSGGLGVPSEWNDVNTSNKLFYIVEYDISPSDNSGSLINISTRGYLSNTGADDEKMIAGFIVEGGSKQLFVSVYGPTLAGFGVSNFVNDPSFIIYDQYNNIVAQNDDWSNDPDVAATTQAPQHNTEPALVHTFDIGSYTVVASAKANESGEVVVGVQDYDSVLNKTISKSVASDTNAKNEGVFLATGDIINISTRGFLDSTASKASDNLDKKMIAGFIVKDTDKKLLISVFGKTLESFGVNNTVADPSFIVYDSNNNIVVQNDDWNNNAEVAATTQAPTDALEPAVVHTFSPGSYTVVVSAAAGQAGEIVVGVQNYNSIISP